MKLPVMRCRVYPDKCPPWVPRTPNPKKCPNCKNILRLGTTGRRKALTDFPKIG